MNDNNIIALTIPTLATKTNDGVWILPGQTRLIERQDLANSIAGLLRLTDGERREGVIDVAISFGIEVDYEGT